MGEAGYTVFAIAELIGHSDIHTTRKYVRILEGKKREAVKAVMFQSTQAIELPTGLRKQARPKNARHKTRNGHSSE